MKSAAYDNRWISVKEKLPERGAEVLVTNGFVFIATHRDNFGYSSWYTDASDYATGITHWMPLPDAPSASDTHAHLWEAVNGNPDEQRWKCKCSAMKIRELREGVMRDTIYE